MVRRHWPANLLLLICLCGCLCNSYGAHAQSKTIVRFDGPENAAVADLNQYLGRFNAGTVQIERVALGSRTGQEFFLERSGRSILIKYTCDQSLSNAVYTLLDALGFRWYGPSEHWTIVPEQLPVKDIPPMWRQPAIRNRSFFGTGGLDFGRAQPYDPENRYKQRWYAWKRRNRFSVDFADVGHSGAAFYQENKALLDAHPEWFSSDGGRQSGRLKIEHPAAVAAYKKWVKQRFQKGNNPFVNLGVDPEDGRGGVDDPLPTGMANIRNHADKWWWLANEVAKDYPENDPNTVISAYAYGDGATNALAPGFRLQKNVYPIIIPYAFQTAYGPEQMVKVWASKITGTMGLYDYWNITQWSLGMPQFNIYNIQPRIQFWRQHKVDGIYLETTDAAGPMGHALWLTGQVMWNSSLDFERIYNKYLDDCFGKAGPAVRKMLDRWSRNYQGAAEVGFSLQDLKAASLLVNNNSAAGHRLNDLKAYVHFMKLYYEHDGTQGSKDALFRYLYSIHHLMLVQTAAFVGQAYISPLDKGNIVPDGQGIRPLTVDEIEQQFQQDLRKTKPAYQLTTFRFDLNRVKYVEPIPTGAWRFGGFQCRFFFQSPITGTVQIDAGAEYATELQISGESEPLIRETAGKNLYDYQETLESRTWSLRHYKIQVKKGQQYQISTSGGYSRVKMLTPGITLFKVPGAEDFDNYQYPIQYFYVPVGVEEIVFTDAQPEGTNGRGYLVSPSGEVMGRASTGFANTFRVKVPAGQSGKTWTANFGHPTWQLRNIPNLASLQKFEYSE